METQTIAAFDLGYKNFAFAVKNSKYVLLKNINFYDYKSKSELQKLNKNQLFVMSNFNEKMSKKDMIDIIVKSQVKTKIDLCEKLIEVMNVYYDIWEKCDIILIERQMTVNLQALKLSHYLETYFKIKFPLKKIINYSSCMKTLKLTTEKLKRKNDRKIWTVKFAQEILYAENNECLTYFTSLNKKDDVSDAICMIESYIK